MPPVTFPSTVAHPMGLPKSYADAVCWALTFNEIADLIDNQSDARTDEWIEEVLTQTIAYLVTVNQ